ncbi:MAG: copper-translocating P-type ATPase [Methanomicrobiaceae archaeon]|nr:copper-translocating P-type ATPase [Methanomicrobiaceae archaeon]
MDEHQGEHGDRKHASHHEMMIADFKRRFFVSLVLTVPILILSPMIQEWAGLGDTLRFSGDLVLLFLLSSVVFFYGGYPFYRGLYDELKARRPGMMTLIGIAIINAYAYSTVVVFALFGITGKIFYWELATLIDVMLFGHWMEMRSVMGASKALEELAQLMPSVAHRVKPDGDLEDVPLNEIQGGDRVVVKPGERIPADGVVVEGASSVDESMVTGESRPVEREPEDEVIGGSLNGEGSLTVEVQKTGKDSFISQVIELVDEAQAAKSQTQNLADRAAFWLTIIALSAGAITLIVWYAAAGSEFVFALERSVTVMVITCPHALGLAIPLVVTVSTALAAQQGFLIRNRTSFENARNLQAVVFDKTGTLTEGQFGVTDTVILAGECDEARLLRIAGSLERFSEHPIAKAIAEAASDHLAVEGFESIPGKGVRGRIEEREVLVVSPGYLREQGLDAGNGEISRLSSQGKTVVYVILDGEVCGAIALADVIREESRQAIETLKEHGIRCMMLTGDKQEVAAWVAEELGLDEVFAEVLPQEKAAKIKEIQSRDFVVAMVGDGVNDAPALAQADVGIAIGAGTDVALEAADIILVKNNPNDVASVIGLGRATYKKMVQNLLWATGYNAVAIPLAAGVLYGAGILLSPAVGAFLMSLSTIIVAVNAQLLKY